jgi:hypothetical protein
MPPSCANSSNGERQKFPLAYRGFQGLQMKAKIKRFTTETRRLREGGKVLCVEKPLFLFELLQKALREFQMLRYSAA